MPTIEAHLRRELHKIGVELRKLAYTLPNGIGEHALLLLSEQTKAAAAETPAKYLAIPADAVALADSKSRTVGPRPSPEEHCG